ncbi:MAG: helix-turn-helix domain-containing protein [Rhizobiaceae bacterium]
MLADTDAQVSQIAGLLDYASTPPFTTAFRRWTGMTPLDYRQHRRETSVQEP